MNDTHLSIDFFNRGILQRHFGQICTVCSSRIRAEARFDSHRFCHGLDIVEVLVTGKDLVPQLACFLSITHQILQSNFLYILLAEVIPIDLCNLRKVQCFILFLRLFNDFDLLLLNFFACQKFSLLLDQSLNLCFCQVFLTGCRPYYLPNSICVNNRVLFG